MPLIDQNLKLLVVYFLAQAFKTLTTRIYSYRILCVEAHIVFWHLTGVESWGNKNLRRFRYYPFATFLWQVGGKQLLPTLYFSEKKKISTNGTIPWSSGFAKEWNIVLGAGQREQESPDPGRSCHCDGRDSLGVASLSVRVSGDLLALVCLRVQRRNCCCSTRTANDCNWCYIWE